MRVQVLVMLAILFRGKGLNLLKSTPSLFAMIPVWFYLIACIFCEIQRIFVRAPPRLLFSSPDVFLGKALVVAEFLI